MFKNIDFKKLKIFWKIIINLKKKKLGFIRKCVDMIEYFLGYFLEWYELMLFIFAFINNSYMGL